MNDTSFFTRRLLGMDYGIWIAMLLVCFFSIGLYGYKQSGFESPNDSACAVDTILVNGKTADVVVTCYLGRASSFEISSRNTDHIEWNFDDESKRENGQFVSHTFSEEKTYNVTATVNGKCNFSVEVEVIFDPFMSDEQEIPVIEIFAEPKQPVAGASVKFYCVADIPKITSYQWKIGTIDQVQTEASPETVFATAGTYSLEVTLNNNPLFRKRIDFKVIEQVLSEQPAIDAPGKETGKPLDIGPLVTPGPNPFTPILKNEKPDGKVETKSSTDTGSTTITKQRAPEIDENTFMVILQSVIDGTGKELEDLYKYLDYKETTMVKTDESTSVKPIKDFCIAMKKKPKGKRKIESVTFKKDPENMIMQLRVNIDNPGFFRKALQSVGIGN